MVDSSPNRAGYRTDGGRGALPSFTIKDASHMIESVGSSEAFETATDA
jgi:hypothetical protein